jgi:hypothetical protein
MASSEPPISPFWSKAKIVLGFAPAIAALGTAIIGVVKAYDQTGPKAIYETLSKKVEENASAIQDTHSDVKSVWAYLNGMAAAKAVDSTSTSTSTETSTSTTQVAPPKVATFYKPKKTQPIPIEEVVGPEAMASAIETPKAAFSAAQEPPESRLVHALPDISPTPSASKLPSFEQVIQESKK